MGLREDLKRWREEQSRLLPYGRPQTVVHPQVFQQLVDEGVITQEGDFIYEDTRKRKPMDGAGVPLEKGSG